MRLPWLQVDHEGITACKLLARLLGVPDTQGIGIGMAMWSYALEIAPEGDFAGLVPEPGILAAAVGWNVDDAPRLVECLQRVGLVATAGGLRVRGLDRYRRAWEKNTGKKAKTATSGGDVPEPGANPARVTPEPARQMKTKTQTETEKATDAVGAPPIAAFEIEQPDTDNIENWTKEDFWKAAELVRRELGLPPEKWPNRWKLNAWWSEARALCDVTELAAAFERFCRDKYALERAPPAPFGLFMTKWNNHLPRKSA